MALSKKQAAEKLGISTKTLERKIADGSIPFYKIGKRVLLDQNDLDSFWKKCRHISERMGGET